MSMYRLNAIAGRILALAATLPYTPPEYDESASPDDHVRQSNEGIERLLACAIGYAFPMPTEAVPSPKLWFGEQYGNCLGTLVSLIGEQRILNPEIVAMGAQGAWLYRYATSFDLTSLASFGQINGCRIAGLEYINDYCRDRNIVNAPVVLTAIDQLGKLVLEFRAALGEGASNG